MSVIDPVDPLLRRLHDARWACDEGDRDTCDPAVNPHSHASQLASIGLWSGLGSSGSSSISATDPSGMRQVESAVDALPRIYVKGESYVNLIDLRAALRAVR